MAWEYFWLAFCREIAVPKIISSDPPRQSAGQVDSLRRNRFAPIYKCRTGRAGVASAGEADGGLCWETFLELIPASIGR
jgi:hypothetical protein